MRALLAGSPLQIVGLGMDFSEIHLGGVAAFPSADAPTRLTVFRYQAGLKPSKDTPVSSLMKSLNHAGPRARHLQGAAGLSEIRGGEFPEVTPSSCRQILHHIDRRGRTKALELLRTGNCLWGLRSVSVLISPSLEEVGCCCGQR